MPRGQPQVDVTFDMDANDILNVSAIESSTGKENKITITNDKVRLSQEEIEHMVSEAEKYKAEDDANKNRVEAKNGLDNYCYSLKSSISSSHKVVPDDKATLEKAIKDTIKWLNNNPSAEKEEYKEKQRALEGIVIPILQKMARSEAPGGMPDMGDPHSSGNPEAGPTIEDID